MSVIRGSSRKGNDIKGASMNDISISNKIQRVRAGVRSSVDSELGDDIDGQ